MSHKTLFKALKDPTEGPDTFRAQVPSACQSPVRSSTDWVVSILPCLEFKGQKTAKATACLESSVLQQIQPFKCWLKSHDKELIVTLLLNLK
ncbi:hypothetical protein I79_002839 [Cricetulus griseus]|uniref:Uncharacterized protein n=1 Tax=Cricetulus griseus TaxID=10029 RepID=G3GYG3_CRIGR|nr:hypothetical protein I79_002839 [Cricetulus griseus]